jgi:hypothetical protein
MTLPLDFKYMPLLRAIGKESIEDLTKIVRQSRDICFYGLKGSTKTLGMTALSVPKWLDGWQIYANYNIFLPEIQELNLKKPIKVSTLNDFRHIGDNDIKNLLIGDDIERYISSKFKSNMEKKEILSITLDFGKAGSGIDFWYSCKSPLEADKSERRVSDAYVKCSAMLQFIPRTLDEYMFMKDYIDFYESIMEVHDSIDVNNVSSYYKIRNLELWCELYDTRYKIKDLPISRSA